MKLFELFEKFGDFPHPSDFPGFEDYRRLDHLPFYFPALEQTLDWAKARNVPNKGEGFLRQFTKNLQASYKRYLAGSYSQDDVPSGNMARSMLRASINEAGIVYVIVRKSDGKLLQKSSSKENIEKEFADSPGYSTQTHTIKKMLDPQQAQAEADPTLTENTEWITHKDLANKIFTHTGNRQLAMDFFHLEDEFVSQDDMQSTGLSALDIDPFEEDRERVNRILSIHRLPFKVLGMKHGEEYQTLYSILSVAPKPVPEGEVIKFPRPEDYPLSKMDKILRRYGVTYTDFINKPYSDKLYELIIDIFMNADLGRRDRDAVYFLANQYRERGVQAGKLPATDK